MLTDCERENCGGLVLCGVCNRCGTTEDQKGVVDKMMEEGMAKVLDEKPDPVAAVDKTKEKISKMTNRLEEAAMGMVKEAEELAEEAIAIDERINDLVEQASQLTTIATKIKEAVE